MSLIPYTKQTTERRTFPVRYNYESDGEIILAEEFLQSVNSTDVFNGFKQPGYRSMIRSGLNATTLASGTKTTVVAPYITAHIMHTDKPQHDTYRVSFTGVPYGSYLSTGSYDFSLDDVIRNEALIGFLKKCKSTQRQFQSGVFVGELRQTLNLIKRPALAFRKLLDSYVQNVRTGAHKYGRKARAKYLSGQWLEYSFGMRPLVADVENAGQALERLYKRLPTRTVSFRAGREKSLIPLSSVTAPFAGGAIPYSITSHLFCRGSRWIRGKVVLNTLGNSGPVLQSLGLNLSDFIPTVYELIPYSFLVDYFTNIGEILEAHSFCRADLRWFSDTWRRDVVQDLNVTWKGPFLVTPTDTLLSAHGDSCQAQYRVQSFTRSNLPLGEPSLSFKIPGIGTKWLNIAALAGMRAL